MSEEGGCLFALFAAAVFVGIVVSVATTVSREHGIERGKAIQFCVDHDGTWDDKNVRCLKTGDTLTVQVKP